VRSVPSAGCASDCIHEYRSPIQRRRVFAGRGGEQNPEIMMYSLVSQCVVPVDVASLRT
jgi:hypothetical protein